MVAQVFCAGGLCSKVKKGVFFGDLEDWLDQLCTSVSVITVDTSIGKPAWREHITPSEQVLWWMKKGSAIERFSIVGVIASSLFWALTHLVKWEEANKKSVLLFVKGSVLEQVKEGNCGGTSQARITWKTAIKLEVVWWWTPKENMMW